MNNLELILARRSVRQYTDEPILQEKLDAILIAGLSAASSKNRRPWEFILVQERETLHRLAQCRPGANRLLDSCAAAIVVAVDAQAVDVWIEECASALTTMHLAASMLGVGSCWLQIRMRQTENGCNSEAVIREVTGLPERYGVMAILTLGMPAESPLPHRPGALPIDQIHHECFKERL